MLSQLPTFCDYDALARMAFLPEDVQYAAWTPEQIMKDYDAEPRGLNLVRLAEWYSKFKD